MLVFYNRLMYEYRTFKQGLLREISMKGTPVSAWGDKTGASLVSKKSITDISRFGERLVALRKAAGFTQQELAQELKISRRMIAYYEGETTHPPTTILPRLAQALGVSADEILTDNERHKKLQKPINARLQRKLQQLAKLGTKERRQVVQLLNRFIQRETLKRPS
jgi:transcriptional regulator with XRE-family HTH domain